MFWNGGTTIEGPSGGAKAAGRLVQQQGFRARFFKLDAISPYRPCDVLEVLIAKVGKSLFHPTAHLLMNDVRNCRQARKCSQAVPRH